MAQTLGFRDFNPASRNPDQFGYSPVRDALHNVYKLFGLVAPLTYPRALDTNHWTSENIQDWQEVAKTIVLQYNKSTEGTWFTDIDSQLATLEGKAAGLISLFYHFIRRDVDGEAQFAYFRNKTEALILQIRGKKIVIIDMETKDGVDNLIGNGNFKGFCNAAAAAGYLVGLYINPSDWVEFGLGSWVNNYVDFYILAHWKPGNNPDKPAGIEVSKIAMQQEGVYNLFSWIEPIPGLVPQMDANLLLWPLAQWETFTGQKYEPGGVIEKGDPILKYTNLTSAPNIRSSPAVINSPSNDVGDLPKNSVIVAKEVRFLANGSSWIRFDPDPAWITKTAVEYWVSGFYPGQGVIMTFHSSVPCPAGEPSMTPEQLKRLESAEATISQHDLEITVLQNTNTPQPDFTHKVVTTELNGIKLDAYPNGGEAVMLPNDTPVRLLKTKLWKGQKLYGAYIGDVWVTGWLAESEVIPL